MRRLFSPGRPPLGATAPAVYYVDGPCKGREIGPWEPHGNGCVAVTVTDTTSLDEIRRKAAAAPPAWSVADTGTAIVVGALLLAAAWPTASFVRRELAGLHGNG